MSVRDPLESGVMPLDKGASVYALADVASTRPILEGLSYIPLNDKNIKQMLDRTRSAAVAVFTPSSQDDRRFQLVSWGNYPASGSSIAFGSNKDWKKQRSAFKNSVYWHSDKAQMSVAVAPSQAWVLAAMTKDPHDPIPSQEGIDLPEGFGEFAKDAVFSCWLSDPGPALNQKLKGAGLPLEIPAQQLFIRLFPLDEQKYEAHIKITLAGATQARTILSFISIARMFMAPPSAADTLSSLLSDLLFANPVTQDGSSLLFKMPPLSASDISLLFSVFSL